MRKRRGIAVVVALGALAFAPIVAQPAAGQEVDPPIDCRGRQACEDAKAICASNGLDGCQAVTTCYVDAVLGTGPGVKDVFPFDCFPPALGDTKTFYCMLYDCLTLDPCIVWQCTPDGRLVGAPVVPPSTTTTTTTTTTPPTTAPPTTAPPTTAPPTTAPPPQVGGIQQQPACDPNYSGVCVPVSSEDLNCEDVPGTDFRVIGDDPHRLDEGGVPGIACESDRGGGGSTDTGASVSGNELALTGSETTAAYIALALLMAGVVAGLAGAVAPPERLRGGFTVRTTDRYGQSVAYRVSRRRTRRS